MTAYDLAHIITHNINERGVTVSPKKLQKLLYYVEAWNLVYLSEPLIDEDFEAWVHGPVLPSLYHKLKDYGFNNIHVVNDDLDTVDEKIERIIKENKLTDDQLDIIDSVLNKYGSLSAFELEMLTHNEDPWKYARGGVAPHQRCNNVISKEHMCEYYSRMVQGHENE